MVTCILHSASVSGRDRIPGPGCAADTGGDRADVLSKHAVGQLQERDDALVRQGVMDVLARAPLGDQATHQEADGALRDGEAGGTDQHREKGQPPRFHILRIVCKQRAPGKGFGAATTRGAIESRYGAQQASNQL